MNNFYRNATDLSTPDLVKLSERDVIMPVVLYGCETWSFTLTEEHRLRVFDNRVLKRIFGPKRENDG